MKPINTKSRTSSGGGVTRRRDGFTLIEIMIVVLTISVLALMGRVAVKRINLRARASAYWNGCPGFLVAARGTEQIRQEAEFAAVKEDARPIVGEAAEAPRV